MNQFEVIIKELRKGLFTVWGFSIVASILLLATPLYMASVYDRVLSSRSLSTLAVLTILAVGALVAHGAIDSVRRLILGRMATKLDAEMSSYLLENSIANESVKATRATEGLTHLSNIHNFITGPAAMAIFDLPIAPIFMVVMFFIHPVLGIVTLLGVAILAVMALINQRIGDPLTKEVGKATERARGVADILARNAEAIRSMGMMDNAIRVWGKPQSEALIKSQNLTSRLSGLVSTSKVVRMILQMSVLGIGSFLVLQDAMSPGLIFVASIVSGRALQPIDAIISNWKTITTARASYERVQEIAANIAPMRKTMRYARPTGKIDIEQLGYAIKGSPKPILQGFSFSIIPGRSLGLIGASGAGKSTLARILSGAISPSTGVVKYDGIDISTWDKTQLGSFVGYVPQDIELIPGTIAENISRMDPEMSSEAVIEVAQLTGIHDFIQNMPNGYNTLVGPGAFQPSGGQRQRIAIARAFYGNPSIIIMDEPNSNLDGAGEEALIKAINAAKGWGATVVVVSHRPALLQAVETVLTIENGRISDYGLRDEVLSRQKMNFVNRAKDKPQASKNKPAKQSEINQFQANLQTRPQPSAAKSDINISSIATAQANEPSLANPTINLPLDQMRLQDIARENGIKKSFGSTPISAQNDEITKPIQRYK